MHLNDPLTTPPKVLLFDLGGVLWNIDIDLSNKAFDALSPQPGTQNFSSVYSKHSQNDLMDRFEIGAISHDEFRKGIEKQCNLPLTSAQFTEAWNALLLDFPTSRLSMLKALRGRYPLALLSNTNEVHIDCVNQNISATYQIASLDTLFDHVFYSFKMGLRKPDPAIYRTVAEKLDAKPSDILFIDDNRANAESAARVGFRVIHLDLSRGMEVTEMLKPLL